MKSKLIEKIEDDSKIAKKINSSELSMACAKKFSYILVKKGETVFKIGDTGDKFFYILKGKVNILKIREIPNLYMSIMEYINYCLFLINNEENFLFQEVIQKNYNILQVSNPEEIKSLYKITFKKFLHDNINQHLIYTNQLLEEYFKAFIQKYSDYNIDKRQLEILDMNKKKKLQGSYKEWQNYILKKSELSTNELVTYEPFEQIFKDRKKRKIVCFIYESFLFLGPGLYFGDFALDSEVNKRNATIRAEEDTYLGWLRSTDYLNIIAPKRRYEKMKEIAFLFNSFFFNNINPHTFERNYFHLFYLREYRRGTVLFNSGNTPKNIYLVKEGQISLDLKCSVIGLHKLIKFLYNKMLPGTFKFNIKLTIFLLFPKEILISSFFF
jgi:CRP-like cAMP-binding protein